MCEHAMMQLKNRKQEVHTHQRDGKSKKKAVSAWISEGSYLLFEFLRQSTATPQQENVKSETKHTHTNFSQ